MGVLCVSAINKLTAGSMISRGDLARVMILASQPAVASRKTFDMFGAKDVAPSDQQLLERLERIPFNTLRFKGFTAHRTTRSAGRDIQVSSGFPTKILPPAYALSRQALGCSGANFDRCMLLSGEGLCRFHAASTAGLTGCRREHTLHACPGLNRS